MHLIYLNHKEDLLVGDDAVLVREHQQLPPHDLLVLCYQEVVRDGGGPEGKADP